MGVKQYSDIEGKIRFRVIVDRRSAKVPSIRVRRLKEGIGDERKARQIELRLVEEVMSQLRIQEDNGISWDALIGEWELAARSGKLDRSVQVNTIRDYLDSLYAHTNGWKHLPAGHITRADVKSVMMSLLASGKSRSVCDKLRSAINAVFSFGQDSRFFQRGIESPAKGLKVGYGKLEEKRPEVLKISEMRTLLEAAGAICHPMFPVWIVALHTGMRSGELFALEWADIDFEGKLIHVTKSYDRKFKQIGPTKGRAWRDVALSEELERYLRELQATSHGRTHVLPRVAAWERGEQARETRIMCRIAEVPSVRFHALRACWTTELLRQGVPAAKVMRMGGWASFSRMEIYARLAGIEIRGATDGLKLIPEARIAKVHHLAGVAVKASPCNIRS